MEVDYQEEEEQRMHDAKMARIAMEKEAQLAEPLRIRLTVEDRVLLNAAAEKTGQETSTWAREILLKIAGKSSSKPKVE